MSTKQITPPSKDCRTCNRRRIKCDRTLPTCQKCKSRSLECPGFGLKLKWNHEMARKVIIKCSATPLTDNNGPSTTTFQTPEKNGTRKYHPPATIDGETSSLAVEAMDIPSPPAHLLPSLIPTFPEFLLDTSTQQLLHHYSHVLAPQLAWIDCVENPWRKIILPLAVESTPVLHSVLAIAAGDMSERHSGSENLAFQDIRSFIGNRDKALQLLAQYLRTSLEAGGSITEPTIQEPCNAVLATTVILCYHELKWPSSGVWKLHFRAAREMIRRWSSMSPISNDPTRNFLVQELFATNAIAAVTCVEEEGGDLRVSIPATERAPFVEFCNVIQRIAITRRDQQSDILPCVPPMKLNELRHNLDRSREHTWRVSQSISFSSTQARNEFGHVVDAFYYAVMIYGYRALRDHSVSEGLIARSVEQLFKSLRELTDDGFFAQDWAWQLFIAGTECRERVEDQQYVERRMLVMVRISGTLDRLKSLAFLKEYWAREDLMDGSTWMDMAKDWAEAGNGFLIW